MSMYRPSRLASTGAGFGLSTLTIPVTVSPRRAVKGGTAAAQRAQQCFWARYITISIDFVCTWDQWRNSQPPPALQNAGLLHTHCFPRCCQPAQSISSMLASDHLVNTFLTTLCSPYDAEMPVPGSPAWAQKTHLLTLSTSCAHPACQPCFALPLAPLASCCNPHNYWQPLFLAREWYARST